MAFDRRCDRLTQDAEDIFVSRKLFDVLDVLLAEAWLLFLRKETLDSCCDQNTSEFTRVTSMNDPEDARNLYSISRLDSINEIILQHHLDRSWELTCWCILWHFLNCDDLRVLVDTISVLRA